MDCSVILMAMMRLMRIPVSMYYVGEAVSASRQIDCSVVLMAMMELMMIMMMKMMIIFMSHHFVGETVSARLSFAPRKTDCGVVFAF